MLCSLDFVLLSFFFPGTKYPTQTTLKEELLILAHGFRVLAPQSGVKGLAPDGSFSGDMAEPLRGTKS